MPSGGQKAFVRVRAKDHWQERRISEDEVEDSDSDWATEESKTWKDPGRSQDAGRDPTTTREKAQAPLQAQVTRGSQEQDPLGSQGRPHRL